MNYIDYITELIMKARKEKDNNRAETLKLIKAKLIEFTTQKNAPELNKQAFCTIIKKMHKGVIEEANIAKDAKRIDLKEKAEYEAYILEQFLPKEATENEINDFLDTVSLEFTQKNMGEIMCLVRDKLEFVDGGLVANLVRRRIISL